MTWVILRHGFCFGIDSTASAVESVVVYPNVKRASFAEGTTSFINRPVILQGAVSEKPPDFLILKAGFFKNFRSAVSLFKKVFLVFTKLWQHNKKCIVNSTSKLYG